MRQQIWWTEEERRALGLRSPPRVCWRCVAHRAVDGVIMLLALSFVILLLMIELVP